MTCQFLHLWPITLSSNAPKRPTTTGLVILIQIEDLRLTWRCTCQHASRNLIKWHRLQYTIQSKLNSSLEITFLFLLVKQSPTLQILSKFLDNSKQELTPINSKLIKLKLLLLTENVHWESLVQFETKS